MRLACVLRRRALAACLLTLLVAALSACGGSSGSSGAGAAGASITGAGKVVDIYSSLPMHGPSAAQAAAVLAGIRLALAQAGRRAGPFMVQYTPLDDSDDAGWDPTQTAANARKAAADPRAVYYIGELDDGATEVSMPILNQAGIPQVSPTNTYVGLTAGGAGSAPGQTNYWPTGTRTYLRIVPTDSIQAAADLTAMKQAGCRRVAVSADADAYGVGLAKLVELQRRYYGIDVVSDTELVPSQASFHSYVAAIKAQRPDCVLLVGVASKAAVEATRLVHAALPKARLFAPSAMCTSAWTNPRDGGVPAGVDPLIECTSVVLSITAYPGGAAFLAAYRARYPDTGTPSSYAILGYEAMKLGLSTIAGLGSGGDSKSAVLSALFSTTSRRSVLGTYGFDRYGDTTLRSFGLYKVGPTGDPAFVRTITPPEVH